MNGDSTPGYAGHFPRDDLRGNNGRLCAVFDMEPSLNDKIRRYKSRDVRTARHNMCSHRDGFETDVLTRLHMAIFLREPCLGR